RDFAAPGKAEIAAIYDFEIVVSKSDAGEGQRGQDGEPDEAIRQIGPQQGWNDNRDHDQHAAHGGRAGFFGVGFGTLGANVLADLKFAKLADNSGTDDQSHEQGGEAGKGGAKSKITEEAERSEEHTSELQSPYDLVCRLLLENK